MVKIKSKNQELKTRTKDLIDQGETLEEQVGKECKGRTKLRDKGSK